MNPQAALISPLRLHRRLLSPHPTEPDSFILNIDNSTFELETTCPRQAELSTIFGRGREGSAPLIYGSAMHGAMESDLNGGTMEDGIAVLQDHFSSAPPFEHLDEWRTFDHALEAYRQYRLFYQNAPLHPVPSLCASPRPSVELPFSIPLFAWDAGCTIPYPKSLIVKDAQSTDPFFVHSIYVNWTGKIDGIVSLGSDGVFVLDHKTTSMVGSTFWEDFALSNQMQGYVWACKKIRPDLAIQGVLINALIGRKPTKSGVAHEFQRQRFLYTDEQMEEWESDTINTNTTFLSRLVQGYFPKHTKWCMGKYGKCKYHQVCTLPQHARTHMLASGHYTDNTWSPLHDKDKITMAIP